MTDENALKHASAWAIQHISDLNKEAKAIMDNAQLSEQERVEQLRGPTGPDYRMLNLILLLRPFRNQAQSYFPEQENFFAWFDERCTYIDEQKFLSSSCACLGCAPAKTVVPETVSITQ